MLLTLLQNRTITPPVSPGGRVGGFSMGGVRETSFKPVLQRALEARAPKVKPPKERAAKRAKAIEQKAAIAVVQGLPEPDLMVLMRDWYAQKPYIPPQAAQYEPMDLFLSQIGFRIQQMQLLEDDEEDIIALLLA